MEYLYTYRGHTMKTFIGPVSIYYDVFKKGDERMTKVCCDPIKILKIIDETRSTGLFINA